MQQPDCIADRAGEIWITAEVRLAEELDRLPKATGGEHGGRKRKPSNSKSPEQANRKRSRASKKQIAAQERDETGRVKPGGPTAGGTTRRDAGQRGAVALAGALVARGIEVFVEGVAP